MPSDMCASTFLPTSYTTRSGGQFYDEAPAHLAVSYYHDFYRDSVHQAHQNVKPARYSAGGRIVTKWVQSQGFVSVDDYCERPAATCSPWDYLKSQEFKAVAKGRAPRFATGMDNGDANTIAGGRRYASCLRHGVRASRKRSTECPEAQGVVAR
jgi:hypothetical protein